MSGVKADFKNDLGEKVVENTTLNAENLAKNAQNLTQNEAQNAQNLEKNSQNSASNTENSQNPALNTQTQQSQVKTAEVLDKIHEAEVLINNQTNKPITKPAKKGLIQRIRGKKLLANLKDFREVRKFEFIQKSTLAQKIKDILLFNSYKSVLFLMGFVVLYYLIFAADRYVSEATISVRATTANASSEAVGNLGVLLGASTSSEDIVHLKSYILSLDMLKALDEKIGIRKLYESQKLDFLFALYNDDDQEKFLKYYKERVKVTEQDGLLNIQVEGFKPQQAYLIATEILNQSEHFVNEISHKGAREQLIFAENELAKYKERYQQATNALTAFQNEHGVFDPLKESGARVGFIGTMEANLAEKEATLLALQSYMNDDAPKIVTLKAEIEALKQQMQKEKARVAPGDSNENLNENVDESGALNESVNGLSSEFSKESVNLNSQGFENLQGLQGLQNLQENLNSQNSQINSRNLQDLNSQNPQGVNLNEILNENPQINPQNQATQSSQDLQDLQNLQGVNLNENSNENPIENSHNPKKSANLNQILNENSQNSRNLQDLNSQNLQIPQTFLQTNSQKGPNELLSEFQRLSVEAEFAQSAYASALKALETTRIEAIRKIKQLVIVQSPTKPESALYPRAVYNTITIFIILSLFFGVVRLVKTIIEEHKY